MRRQAHDWRSPSTAAPARLVRLGHAGHPLVYLPTSGGDQAEFERYGMDRVCAPWIDSGRVQVFSVDAGGPDTLFNDGMPPAERMSRYAAVERCLTQETLPWIAEQTGSSRVTLAGCSYGAFVAANLWLKHTGRIRAVCGMGGVYGMWHRLDGHHDDDVYFHTPLDYLPGLDDPATLEALRRTRGMALFAARDDEWLDSTVRMARLLRDKRLPHRLEIWPSPADHHERWWRKQLERFLQDSHGQGGAWIRSR